MLGSLPTTVWILLPLFAGWLLYLIFLAVYRLLFSHLAGVPGPRLAALTGWYEVYWDLVQSARFPWHLKTLHERYGAVVRITPTEVHISDPSFANTLFANTVKRDKYEAHRDILGIPQSTIGTVLHDQHRIRRVAMAKLFSKKNILTLEPMIKQRIEICCSRLEEFRSTKKVLNLRLLFSCFTMDIITEFAFARSYDELSTPDLSPNKREIMEATQRVIPWFKHFPSLWPVVRAIPYNVLVTMAPDIRLMLESEVDIEVQARKVMNEHSNGQKTNYSTIFHELLDSDLPPAEKSFNRLSQEGQSLVGAGTETTSNALTYIFVSLLLNPEKLARLKQELLTLKEDISIQRLEQLPYLNAVIAEGLRLAVGVTNRFIRVTPDQSIIYKDYVFPPGTPISMSSVTQHSDPHLFPNPTWFEPERWLDGSATKENLLSFSRGPRSCIGMYLAYAELYLMLGWVLSRFDFQLFETTREDIEPAADGFVPLAKADSKGARVFVM